VFRALGVEQAVAAAGFVEKWGARLHQRRRRGRAVRRLPGASDRDAAPADLPGDARRADRILLENAARGAEVVQWHGARGDVAPAHVTPRYAAGKARTRARGGIVDASGRRLPGTAPAGCRVDPLLRNVAVHCWYEGVPRQLRGAGDIRR
jgi:hypothetical protein